MIPVDFPSQFKMNYIFKSLNCTHHLPSYLSLLYFLVLIYCIWGFFFNAFFHFLANHSPVPASYFPQTSPIYASSSLFLNNTTAQYTITLCLGLTVYQMHCQDGAGPHAHLPETDLLLSMRQGTSILYNLVLFHPVQVIGLKQTHQIFPEDLPKKASFCGGRKCRVRPCFSHVYQRKRKHYLQRGRENQIHRQEQRLKSEAEVWARSPSWFILFLRPAALQSFGFLITNSFLNFFQYINSPKTLRYCRRLVIILLASCLSLFSSIPHDTERQVHQNQQMEALNFQIKKLRFFFQ